MVETSTLTEEGVIKVKTEVSASLQAGVDLFIVFLLFQKSQLAGEMFSF